MFQYNGLGAKFVNIYKKIIKKIRIEPVELFIGQI